MLNTFLVSKILYYIIILKNCQIKFERKLFYFKMLQLLHMYNVLEERVLFHLKLDILSEFSAFEKNRKVN